MKETRYNNFKLFSAKKNGNLQLLSKCTEISKHFDTMQFGTSK